MSASRSVCSQLVDVTVPQIRKRSSSWRTVMQMVDVPIPQVMEENVDAVEKSVPGVDF